MSRVVACSRRAEQESLRGVTALVSEHVSCGVDIAMAFFEDGDHPTLYYGRIVALFSTVRGREEIIEWPVSIMDAPSTLTFQCDWFYPYGRANRGRFLLGIKDGRFNHDLVRYPLTAFVGLVDMQILHEHDRDVFKLIDNGQLQRFKDKAQHMGPAAVSRTEVENLRQRQREREHGNYYREFRVNHR